jgi:hypothetical protein
MFAAMTKLGISRHSVLQKIKRGELEAILVTTGRKKGIRVKMTGAQPTLFEHVECTMGAV